MASRTRVRAGSRPPMSSTTRSARRTRPAESVVSSAGSTTGSRGVVVSRTATPTSSSRAPVRAVRSAACSCSSRTTSVPTVPQPSTATRSARSLIDHSYRLRCRAQDRAADERAGPDVHHSARVGSRAGGVAGRSAPGSWAEPLGPAGGRARRDRLRSRGAWRGAATGSWPAAYGGCAAAGSWPAARGGCAAAGSGAEELGAQGGDVALGLDVVLGGADRAVRVDDEGGAVDAVEGPSVDRLGPPRAVGLGHGVVGVGEQREGEVLGGGEGPEVGDRVGGDPQHGVAGLLERGEVVAEVAGLGGAAGGTGLRVEVHDDALACFGQD